MGKIWVRSEDGTLLVQTSIFYANGLKLCCNCLNLEDEIVLARFETKDAVIRQLDDLHAFLNYPAEYGRQRSVYDLNARKVKVREQQ